MADAKFPARLRSKRKARGYTQAQLAEAVGVSVQAVSQWETGQTGASHERIVSLGAVLGVDWDWLGYGEERADPDCPPTESIDTPGDLSKGPLLTRAEIADWLKRSPNLEIEPYNALGMEEREDVGDHWEWFEPRHPPTGTIFASGIYSNSMLPMFEIGDVLVFDTAISPGPGDFILIFVAKNCKVLFRRYVIESDPEGNIFSYGVPQNPDYPRLRLAAPGRARIIATMIEHRRYRNRNTPTMGHLARLITGQKSRDA